MRCIVKEKRRPSAGALGSMAAREGKWNVPILRSQTRIRPGTPVSPAKLSGMTAEIYPSGAWRGFYSYGAGDRHGMQLDLLFSGGVVAGDGMDDVGSFVMHGSYDPSGACRWTKTYIGFHDVAYSGARDGDGIAGTCELRGGHGTFRIWPGRCGDATGADESLGVPEPVEALTAG